MTWENPVYLWLLLGPLLVLLVSALYKRQLKKRRSAYFSDEVFAKLYTNEIPGVRTARSSLIYLGSILLIIALAGPQIGVEIREVERRGVDIMVVLDVSRSMLAQDVRPNRLDKAKFEILRMVDRLRGDRVGLIAFSGEAIQLAPLTTDYAAFRTFLNIAGPEMMPSGSTVFAEALQTAIRAFDSAGEEQRQTARVILLISDGEDHGPDTTELKQQLVSRNIYIHTVGIGTTAGATIPVHDPNTGRLLDYVRDRNDQIVTTRLEPALLRQFADAGRGQYYEISRSADGMDGFISQISDLDARSFATQEFADYRNQYQWFAAFGLIFIMIALALPRFRPPAGA
ncbi:MAG: VWA domain-containing protein [Bacteroidetes bacterium]|nr:VWA domain-containing protein [Bacteroidota bacterium]MCH8524442.1 VWA domain-containing protein [Balneolales bacterium]